MIVLVLGLPGSGKSYFAEKLAHRIGADYVNSDRLRRKLFTDRTYSHAEKAQVYEAMRMRVRKAMDLNRDVIVDATFHTKSVRRLFEEMALGNLAIIEVQTDDALVEERLRKERPYSEADFGVYLKIKGEWEPIDRPHLILQSTNDNIEDMLAKALDYLNDDFE